MTLEQLLPKAAQVNKFIPKSKFYEKVSVSKQAKEEFADKIQKITWRYKLAESTIGIVKTDSVTEIQVFDIELKEQRIPTKVLKLIDSGIPYQILYRFIYKTSFSYGITLKESKKPEAYYFSEWNADINFDFTGADLEVVYQKLIKAFISEPFKTSNDFSEIIRTDKQAKLLQAEIDRLEQRINKEKQFNRKVELNKVLLLKKEEYAKLHQQGTNDGLSH
ncbi:MAG: DUF4391 domain-containing protein [Candidatus Cloacimonetes bacterium]|nr:DUF4391 domain-containing protein [Candidatus Cloacimonadota bacterium]